MTMNMFNLFGSRMMAAVFALALSATMVAGAVGPAFNGVALTQIADGSIA